MTGVTDSSSLASLLGTSTVGATIPDATSENSLNQQDFFELMITQFQNQDPFEPMENGDFLAQIAQFSTVDGISSLNSSFSSLSSQLTADQALQASSLIDREVMVPASSIQYDGSTSIGGQVAVPVGADTVMVEIRDLSGQVVRSFSASGEALGEQFDFQWDGLNADGSPVAAGSYSIEARAASNGSEVAVATSIAGRVMAVQMESSGLVLEVAGLGDVSFSSVSRIA